MPMLVQWLVLAVVSFAISYLLRPKIGQSPAQSAEPPGEAEMPTVAEGGEVPVFFGVVWTGDPSVVWWGDASISTRTYEERA